MTGDICGLRNAAEEITTAERQAWPSLAAWIRHVCPKCRAMFQRRGKTKATA